MSVFLFIEYPKWLIPEIIPGLPLRWYGLMYVVNFVLCYMLLKRQKNDIEPALTNQKLLDVMFWTIVGVLIGARIFATTIYDTSGYYLSRPWEIIWPFDANMQFVGLQGMSYHGGLVGAGLGLYLYSRIKEKAYSFLELADLLAIAFPLGYTFGRLGNFINGELYGRISTLPFAVLFPNAERLSITDTRVASAAEQLGISASDSGLVNLPRHPSQIYEALLEGVLVWLIMWFVIRKRKSYPGFALGAYTVLYGITRFIAEYFRQPDTGLDFVIQAVPNNPNWLFLSIFNITMGQLLSFGMVLAGIAILAIFKKKQSISMRSQLLRENQKPKKNQRKRFRKK